MIFLILVFLLFCAVLGGIMGDLGGRLADMRMKEEAERDFIDRIKAGYVDPAQLTAKQRKKYRRYIP